jgi:hypothetical protein
MKPFCVVALLLASLYSAFAVPVRPKSAKAKATAALAHGPHRPSSRSEAIQHAKAAKSGTKTIVRRVVITRVVHGRLVKVSRVVRVKTVPIVPPHPDADRLKEIQKALADKGYFKGEVNGTWDADSVAAMKQFQSDKNLSPDGKITALSLIGLGLGPKHDGSVASLPTQKPEPNIPQ